MACGGFFGCILKLLNFLMTLAGLAMIGYGIYLFIEYEQSSSANVVLNEGMVQLGRPFLASVALNSSVWTELSSAWFICVFIGVGVLLFVLSCFGLIGASTGNWCCLSCYATFVVLLILIELGCAAFIFFDSSWEDVVPTDSTGYFDDIYAFLKDHWTIVKWVALGIVVLEAVLFLLSLLVRNLNRTDPTDSDDDLDNPRQPARQPSIPQTVPLVAGALDQRPIRNDAWSTRMREKYGLDTSEYTYNPNDPGRNQPLLQQPEEKGRCTIM